MPFNALLCVCVCACVSRQASSFDSICRTRSPLDSGTFVAPSVSDSTFVSLIAKFNVFTCTSGGARAIDSIQALRDSHCPRRLLCQSVRHLFLVRSLLLSQLFFRPCICSYSIHFRSLVVISRLAPPPPTRSTFLCCVDLGARTQFRRQLWHGTVAEVESGQMREG
jgi:hypothetical protein